jgi:type III pantothenate kinase
MSKVKQPKQILALDIGNTRVKAGLVSDGHLVSTISLPTLAVNGLAELKGWLGDAQPIATGLLSTGQAPDEWQAALHIIGIEVNIITGQSMGPIQNDYLTPETLGADRWAAATGAHCLHPYKACLVIDAGTALTTDLVTAEGHYLGGSISPGLKMRLQALHDHTARLPKVEVDEEAKYPGRDTAKSMQAGALWGMLGEIQGFIHQAESELGSTPVVFMTGGDAHLFEKRVKKVNFAHPHLVLEGVYHLLRPLF